ncbi:AAA family ATPase [Catenulispora sp. NL8]|uniref:AAA family ATPase n=1 Tax=Catenulispora pinistramenti TaxID=2705254 RepID=A0ABS5KPA0_9ACTN|nr:AAA family ATPase [Catenulispora pinistramenti]MBS2547861.1 AAA family ATPase [Catenulispora pinistramenti]
MVDVTTDRDRADRALTSAAGADGLFVGREAELDVLTRMLGQLQDGLARVIEVTGEPGIGKSRMLAEVRRRAAERGAAVFGGTASEPARDRPFALLVDALDDPLAGLDVDDLGTGISDGALRLLGTVFPSLAAPAAARGPAQECVPPPDLHRVYRAMQELLRAKARPTLVLALDDLHHADEESLEIIAQLVRRPVPIPLLLVLAYRPRQISARLRAALVGTAWTHERLHLGPLAERDMERLLGERGTAGWRRTLYRESQGNPFYLKALSSCDPQVPAAGSGWSRDKLPHSVEAVLLAEFDALTDAAQLMARSGAVLGESFSPKLAAAIAGLKETRALPAIDELAARDLVRPAAGTHELAFRHTLVHRVVYDSAKPGWLLGAHARAAVVMELEGHSAVVRAHHVERIAGPGDLAALEVLAEAAEAVRWQAPATAARWLTAALRLVPDNYQRSPRRLELSLRLGTALGVSGHPAASRDVLREVLCHLPDEPRGPRAEAVAFCAMMNRLLRRHTEANALLDREISAHAGSDTAELAMLEFERASSELMAGGIAAARDLARRAQGTAGKHGLPGLQAAALGLQAVAACLRGDVRDTAKYLEEGAAIVDGLLDSELAERLDAAVWVGWGELLLERPHDALRHIDRALALAHAREQFLALPHPLVARFLILRSVGRLAEATSCAEDAVDLAQLSGSGEQRAGALVLYRWARAWTRKPDPASRPAEPGQSVVEDWFESVLTFIRAEHCLESGDTEACLAAIRAGGLPELERIAPWSRVEWYELLTRVALCAGHVEEAQSWADRALSSAADLGLPGRCGLALLAQAQVAAQRAPAAALEPARAALRMFQESGMVIDELRARILVGSALAASGDAERAAAELQSVRQDAQAYGALRLADHTTRTRREPGPGAAAPAKPESGPGPESEPESAIAALTGREKEVAVLVSDGLTNRQIARRLRLAEKTIETHLSHIFAKLEVSSRTAVAGMVLREVRRATEY